ncbi:MAG: hypothetical protein B0D87_05970, partial [Candidatus Sedimenticola endophacoides]
MTPSPARPGVSRIAVKAYAVLVGLGLLMATVFHLTIVEAVRDNALAQQEQSALALIEQARLNLESEAQWLANLEAHELERRLEHLKSFIHVALTITEDVHLGHHDMALFGATRREHALEHIQSLRFGQGNYVWVIDGQGLTLAHPNPDLVGRNVSDLKDTRGRPVIRPFLEQLKTTEEASNRYLFPRAGSSEPVEKLSHARRFAPWDWIIGSGIYLDEYQAALAQERRNLIRRTDERMRRLRLNSSGYLFIFDGQLQLISHPRREAIRADDAPERRQDKLDTLLSGLRKVADAGGRRHAYYWNRPEAPDNYGHQKIAWIEHVPALDWYVCATIYTDDFTAIADRVAGRITSIALVLLVVIFSIAFYTINRGLRPLQLLARSAEEVSRGNYDLEIRMRRNDEIGQLAEAFARMLARIRGDLNGYKEAKEHAEASVHEQARLLDAARRTEQSLSFEANHDPLTSLYNRKYLDARLTHAVCNREAHGRLAVLFIDLDRFKEINDRMGHRIGDQLLQAVAGRLRQRIRRLDTLARLGGDEFVLVMTQISGREDARALAEALLESLREPFVLPDGETITLGASIGVSLCPEDAGQPDQLIEFADLAMYRAKKH